MNAKKFIEESLLNLLKKKSIDKIKVSEIIREVETCKGTFYKYYRDKYDLLISCFNNRIYNEIIENSYDWKSFMNSCLEAFSKMPNIVLHAFKSQDINSIRSVHDKYLADFFKNELRTSSCDESKVNEVVTNFCAFGYTEIMLNWLIGGMKESKEALIEFMQEAMPHSIYAQVYAIA